MAKITETIFGPLFRLWGRVAFLVLRLMRAISLSGPARRLGPNLRLPGWIPLLGDIDARHLAPPASVRFGGSSSMSAPTLEIRVDGQARSADPRALAPVARLFAGRPPFVFNVCFSCGEGGLLDGVYADPASIWFNIFFGYYQIDVPRPAWDRPFGYQRDAAGDFRVHQTDLATIGEADWNYFSNFLYGVPLGVVERHDQVDPAGHQPPRRVRVGAREWDAIELTGVSVASAYTARPGELESWPHPFLRGLWRAAFGGPRHRPEAFPTSFFPTRMRARIVMAWHADDRLDRDLGAPTYRTLIFGATCDDIYPDRLLQWRRASGAVSDAEAAALRAQAERDNRAFLDAQDQALRTLIVSEFSHLGFTPDSASRGDASDARSGGAARE